MSDNKQPKSPAHKAGLVVFIIFASCMAVWAFYRMMQAA